MRLSRRTRPALPLFLRFALGLLLAALSCHAAEPPEAAKALSDKQFARAIMLCDAALASNPADAETLALRGWARHQSGDSQAALADLQEAVRLEPRLERARSRLGRVLNSLGREEEALGCFRELTRLFPSNTAHLLDLGTLCNRLGRLEEGLVAAGKLCALSPTLADAHGLRGSLLEKQGKKSDALNAFQEAAKLNKDPRKASYLTKAIARLSGSQPSAEPSAEPTPGPAAPPPSETAAVSALTALAQTQDFGSAAAIVEALRLVYSPLSPGDTKKFERTWTPFFTTPSPESRRYLEALLPLLQEFQSLRTLLSQAAASYDGALEEATLAALYSSDTGTRTALAEAALLKGQLTDLRTRLSELTARIQALGAPPDPVAARKRQGKAHQEALRVARRALGLHKPDWLHVNYEDLPAGWVVHTQSWPAGRRASKGGLRKAAEGPYLYSSPHYIPPPGDRHAYLSTEETEGYISFTYVGADLLSAVKLQVVVRTHCEPLATPEQALKASGLADPSWYGNTPGRPATDTKGHATTTELAGMSGYLAMTEEFTDAPLSGSRKRHAKTYYLDPGYGSPSFWLEIDVMATLTYRHWLKDDPDPAVAALSKSKAALYRKRLDTRCEDLIRSLGFGFDGTGFEEEFARLGRLNEYAAAHAMDQQAADEKGRTLYHHQRKGAWVRHSYEPDREPKATTLRIGLHGDTTVFVHRWSAPPERLIPGRAYSFQLDSENTRASKDRAGDIADYQSRATLRGGSADFYLSPGEVHSDPKVGPIRASSQGTLIPQGPEENDYNRVIGGLGLILSFNTTNTNTPELEYSYRWDPEVPADNPQIPPDLFVDSQPDAAATATPARSAAEQERERKEKQERIEEIRNLVTLLERNLAREQEELQKATTDAQRADLRFRVLGLQSNLQAELDLIRSLETGTLVHTRTPFEAYTFAVFEQQCQAEARQASQVIRALQSANRLAALLPPDQADTARGFIQRQFSPGMLAAHDTAKARKAVNALFQQVQGTWEGEAAKQDDKAALADLGFEAASNIKAGADTAMGVCSLLGGNSINLAYQAATGYAEGGFTQAAKNTLSTWSDALDYGFTAYDAAKDGGLENAAKTLALKYAQAKVFERIAGKLTADLGSAPAATNRPSLQERFDAAKFRQEREWGEALVKDFSQAQASLLKAGAAGADPAALMKLQAAAREKAAIVASSLHAKNCLKYATDAGVGRAYDAHMRALHADADARLLQDMKRRGWNADDWDLVEFRNSSSLGKPNMDRDVGLVERTVFRPGPDGRMQRVPQLTKAGQPMPLEQWQREAQDAYNRAYRAVSGGRSASTALENVTVSTHPEAYRDLLWISDNPAAAAKGWAAQAADVSRHKTLHMQQAGDPASSYFTRLQEASRGAAKDMETKFLPLLNSAKPAGTHSSEALIASRAHWAEIHRTLQAFGRNQIDPLTASRRIRELSGGRDLNAIVDEMGTLLESLSKFSRR